MADARQRIEAVLAPLAADHGLELWEVEIGGAARRPQVRVFLDKEGGVTSDDLAAANAWIGEALDELGIPSGPYVLEVSSPGIERSLRRSADFLHYAGQKAEIRLREALDGRKTFTGVIAEANADAVTLDLGGEECVTLPYERISKARLRADILIDDGRSTS